MNAKTAGAASELSPLVVPLASVPSDAIRTESWRTRRPVIHLEKCTRCNLCWKFCPDLAIRLDESGYPTPRAEYCKGCGICAEECSPGAIDMIPEE